MTALRPFGIELETFHNTRTYTTSQAELPREFEAMNIRARAASYTGSNYSVWQIKTDASIRASRNANQQSGVEIVSRILPANEQSIAEVRKVADHLDASGYRVNASTGFHVHLDVSDLPLRTRIAVALRWSLMREEIKTFLPPSRHDGYFTSFLSGSSLTKVQNAVVTASRAANWTHSERYTACNLEHVQSRGCIEFRQAAGTLNANKIEYWVRFLNEFCNDTAEIMREIDRAPTPVVDVAPAPVSADVTANTSAGLSIALTNRNRFRVGSRSRSLLDTLILDAQGSRQGVNADDVCRVTGWSRVNFTDTVWALNNAGVPVTRIRRGVYRLATSNENAATPAPVRPAPVASSNVNASEIVAKLMRPFADKLSAPVANWIRERKSVFAEDMGNA